MKLWLLCPECEGSYEFIEGKIRGDGSVFKCKECHTFWGIQELEVYIDE